MQGFGPSPFSRADMLAALPQFVELYARRPIADNMGGMSSTHLFLFWFAMRTLKPSAVIESGVWHGQGTWLIEQACPDAAIYCIDLDWSHLQYRSSRARYLSEDIAAHDWRHLDKASTLVFFDDHIDPMKRFRVMLEHGFRHLMFEDNYPFGRGDCYSLLEIFAHTGHRKFPGWRARVSRWLGRLQDRDIAPNTSDADYVRSIASSYEILPPIYRGAATRWGDAWPAETPEALLTEVREPWQQVLRDESKWYTWMCYLRLQ